jgi:hypothetical protein
MERAMLSFLRCAIVAASCSTLLVATPTWPSERIGQAVSVKTTVTGQSGPLAVSAPVHQDERIRTSNTGLGEFVFRDGTKFVVGWGSSIALDKFVFDGSNSAKKFTVNATKGTFRWISGKSKSSAYQIVTAAGTLGIRGTAFDFYVGANGTTAVVLLSGSVRFCGSNGCRVLNRRCDVIVASRANGVSNPRRVSRDIFKALGTVRALPFLSGNQKVSRQFRVGGSDCGLSTASFNPGETVPRGPGKGPKSTSPRATEPGPSPSPDPESPPAPEPPAETKHANNGKGNGGGDGSPNGKNDADR